jgi:hypothetical protein
MFKEILQSFARFLLNATDKAVQTSAGLTVEDFKQFYIDNAEENETDEWVIDLGFCKYIHDRNSWSMARGAGVRFLDMLERANIKTFEVLREIGSCNNVKTVWISSLWRPGGGVHTAGRGIDLGRIEFERKNIILYRSSQRQTQPIDLKNLRLRLWETGKITQWIGPWKKRGVIGERAGWHKNENRTQICRTHRDHVHLTVRG